VEDGERATENGRYYFAVTYMTLSLAYMHIVLPLLIIFAIISKTLFNLKGMIVSSIPGGDIFVLKMRKIRYQLRSQYGNNPRGRC
jgi:hypothetical protein